jgi:hypothetical protein
MSSPSPEPQGKEEVSCTSPRGSSLLARTPPLPHCNAGLRPASALWPRRQQPHDGGVRRARLMGCAAASNHVTHPSAVSSLRPTAWSRAQRPGSAQPLA